MDYEHSADNDDDVTDVIPGFGHWFSTTGSSCYRFPDSRFGISQQWIQRRPKNSARSWNWNWATYAFSYITPSMAKGRERVTGAIGAAVGEVL